MPKITCTQGLLETLYSLDIILKEQIWALRHRSRERRDYLLRSLCDAPRPFISHTHTHTHAKAWSELKDFGRSDCSVCVVTLWWIALCRMESCKSWSSSKALLYITAPLLMQHMYVCFLSFLKSLNMLRVCSYWLIMDFLFFL